MRLLGVEVGGVAGGRVRLSGRLADETVWFEVPEDLAGALSTSGNPWLACLLPLAVARGEPLELELPVDPVLLDNARERLAIWRAWNPRRPIVPIVAATAPPARRGDKIAAFFSGGVDSFFTVLAPRAAAIDDLILMHGALDLHFERDPSLVERRLEPAAAALGKRLVRVASNVFAVAQAGKVDLLRIGFGPMLGSVALALEGRYARVLIPGSLDVDWLYEWGTHPLTDALLSTSATTVLHDTVAFTRMDKVELVAASPVALAALRYCNRSQAALPCGRCEKCVRTRFALMLAGAPGVTVDLETVARVRLRDEEVRYYWRDIERWARAHGHVAAADTVARLLDRSMRLERLRAAARPLLDGPLGPALRRVARRLRM